MIHECGIVRAWLGLLLGFFGLLVRVRVLLLRVRSTTCKEKGSGADMVALKPIWVIKGHKKPNSDWREAGVNGLVPVGRLHGLGWGLWVGALMLPWPVAHRPCPSPMAWMDGDGVTFSILPRNRLPI